MTFFARSTREVDILGERSQWIHSGRPIINHRVGSRAYPVNVHPLPQPTLRSRCHKLRVANGRLALRSNHGIDSHPTFQDCGKLGHNRLPDDTNLTTASMILDRTVLRSLTFHKRKTSVSEHCRGGGEAISTPANQANSGRVIEWMENEVPNAATTSCRATLSPVSCCLYCCAFLFLASESVS